MRCLLAIVIAAGLAAAEPETWTPADHPAELVREVHGVTRPLRSLELASEVAGRVVALPLAEGAVVPDEGAGRALALRLDDALARRRLEAATAAVGEAEAAVASTRAEAAIAARERDYRALERERIRRLIADGRLSQRERDQAEFDADRAALAAEAAATRVAAAEAALASTRAREAEAEAELARYTVHAPAGWVVAERVVEPGAVVQPGAPALRLHDLAVLEVALRLDEEEIASLDRTLELHFPDFDATAEARVARIDLDYDPASRKRLVLLQLPGEAAPVASGGLVAVARLRVPMGGKAAVVPTRFVTRGRQRSFVELVDGSRIEVVPLRESGGETILAGDALPPDAVLRVPRSAAP